MFVCSQSEVRLGLDYLRKLSEPDSDEMLDPTFLGLDSPGQRLFPLKRTTDIPAPNSDKKHSTSSDTGSCHDRARLFHKQGSVESFEKSEPEHYRVICEFKKRKPGEVSLMEGAIVDVLETDLSGEWVCVYPTLYSLSSTVEGGLCYTTFPD